MFSWTKVCIFFFKQKTAYEMRISDWSSDGCSSDLNEEVALAHDRRLRIPVAEIDVVRDEPVGIAPGPYVDEEAVGQLAERGDEVADHVGKIGRASCRERVCQYV